MVGRTLAHYKILEELGAGGMGVVYLAEDTRLGRLVALKVLPPALVSDPEVQGRFQDEARIVARLNHPNIVTIHSVEEAKGVDFLTMELVEGRRLSELIPPGGLPLHDFLELAVPLADAVSAAHEHGITHRDLKPDNVMVTDEGRLKVLDFGLAKILDLTGGSAPSPDMATAAITQQGVIRGTVSYMSPEQARGEPVDHRSDIFSLGVVLYEMASGKQPFRGLTAADLISSILRENPARVADAAGNVPRHLERIIHHCLEKELRKRFQTALDVRNELEDLRRELGGDTGPVAPTARGVNPTGQVRRQTRRRWSAGLAAGGLLTAGALYLALRQQPVDPALETAVAAPDKIRLVVLPFTNLSPDPGQEYFSDGLTEEMIAHLGSLQPERLGVIARTSAMRYKGSKQGADEIGRELDVDFLLEGSVRREGERLRITAQLIQVSDQTHLWAESYERQTDDVFGIQNEIAGRVARSLEVKLLSDSASSLPAAPVSRAAYDAYLKGTFIMNKLTPEALWRSIEHFRRAIELAPEWAPAYWGLASGYHMLGSFDYAPDLEVYPLAKVAAREAVALDGSFAPAYASLGFVSYKYDWDWAAAERSFQRALELNPNHPDSHHMYGLFLYALGRFEAAVVEMERTVELDPLSVLARMNLGLLLVRVGHHDLATRQLSEAIELDPAAASALIASSYIYWQTGAREQAVQELERAIAMQPDPRKEATLGFFYAILGRRDRAIEILERLAAPGGPYLPPVEAATLYAALDHKDRAFELLEEAYRQRDDDLVNLRVDIRFESLRSDRRFQDLVQRMRFPRQ